MRKYYSMIFSSGWFLRDGENNYGNKAGVFQFEYWNGNQYNSCGARAVLLLLDYNIVPMVTLAYISSRTYIISDNVEVFILVV